MSRIVYPSCVGQPLILRLTVTDSDGVQVVSPTVVDGDVLAKFTGGSQLSNKHAASPGAGEFRTDVTDGFIVCTFASTDTIHHEFWVRLKDQDSGQWVGYQLDGQLLFKSSDFDDAYRRFYGYDGTTVVAHKSVSKQQISNGDSPETFRDVVTEGSLIYGDVP